MIHSLKSFVVRGIRFIKKNIFYDAQFVPVSTNLTVDLKKRVFHTTNPSIIFDVGANIGQTAQYFSSIYPQASIHCFEPVASTFTQLSKNVSEKPNVKCHKYALGNLDEVVEIALFEGKSSELNSLVKESQNLESGKLESIQVTTGDQFCRSQSIEYIDILKIDTEGFELEVLQGFEELLAQDKIKTLYCEVGLHPSNTRNTYISKVIEAAVLNRFTFFGMYEVRNRHMNTGHNYANVLFVHNNHLDTIPIKLL